MTAAQDRNRLLQLVHEPAEELLPLLERAAAFAPLVVFLALVPSLMALEYAAPDMESSLWVLRSLTLGQPDAPAEWWIPGRDVSENPLTYQPPGLSWVQAALMRVLGTDSRVVMWLPSYLGNALTVGMVYLLGRRWLGVRVAILMAFVAAFHGQTLRNTESGGPYALEGGLLLASCYFFQKLLAARGRRRWLPLLNAILSLAALVLTAGPVAVAALPLLVATCFCTREEVSAAGRGRPGAPGEPVSRLLATGLLAVVLCAGLAASLWWNVWMLDRFGPDFVEQWVTGIWEPTHPIQLLISSGEFLASTTRPRADRAWLMWQAPLIGWQVLGFYYTVRRPRPAARDGDAAYGRALLFWVMLGTALWVIAATRQPSGLYTAMRWQVFLLFPTIAYAAIGLDAVSRRVIGGPALIVSLIVTTLWTAWGIYVNRHSQFTLSAIVFFTLYLTVIVGLVWWQMKHPHRPNFRRHALQFLVVGLMAGHGAWGYLTLYRPNDDARTLGRLRAQLAGVPPLRRALVVGPRGAVPPQILQVIRTTWPAVEVRVVDHFAHQDLADLDGPPATPGPVLVVEWSRRDTRPNPPAGSGWIVRPASDPMRFRGRKIVSYVLLPRSMISTVAARL